MKTTAATRTTITGSNALTRKSDAASPVPVVNTLTTQNSTPTSGTFESTRTVGSAVVLVMCPVLQPNPDYRPVSAAGILKIHSASGTMSVAEVAARGHGPLGLAVVLALAQVLALALGHRDLDLGAPVAEVDRERNYRVPALLGLVLDLQNLGLVQQQLAL